LSQDIGFYVAVVQTVAALPAVKGGGRIIGAERPAQSKSGFFAQYAVKFEHLHVHGQGV